MKNNMKKGLTVIALISGIVVIILSAIESNWIAVTGWSIVTIHNIGDLIKDYIED